MKTDLQDLSTRYKILSGKYNHIIRNKKKAYRCCLEFIEKEMNYSASEIITKTKFDSNELYSLYKKTKNNLVRASILEHESCPPSLRLQISMMNTDLGEFTRNLLR